MAFIKLRAAESYLHLRRTWCCKGAASADHPAKGLGFRIPLAKWGWKSSEMPQVSAGLEGICGSLCAKTAFRGKGTAQVLMRAVTQWSTSRRTGFSTPRLNTVWLLTQHNTAIRASMQEKKGPRTYRHMFNSLFPQGPALSSHLPAPLATLPPQPSTTTLASPAATQPGRHLPTVTPRSPLLGPHGRVRQQILPVTVPCSPSPPGAGDLGQTFPFAAINQETSPVV